MKQMSMVRPRKGFGQEFPAVVCDSCTDHITDFCGDMQSSDLLVVYLRRRTRLTHSFHDDRVSKHWS